MIPYEVWKGYKPNVKHIHIFGCSPYAYIPNDERTRMDPKVKKSIFFRYDIRIKGIGTETLRVFHSRDVIFNESASIGEEGRRGVGNQPQVKLECQNIGCDDDDNLQEVTGLRRSPKIRKAPDKPEWV